jgi:hypothetical protein
MVPACEGITPVMNLADIPAPKPVSLRSITIDMMVWRLHKIWPHTLQAVEYASSDSVDPVVMSAVLGWTGS